MKTWVAYAAGLATLPAIFGLLILFVPMGRSWRSHNVAEADALTYIWCRHYLGRNSFMRSIRRAWFPIGSRIPHRLRPDRDEDDQ